MPIYEICLEATVTRYEKVEALSLEHAFRIAKTHLEGPTSVKADLTVVAMASQEEAEETGELHLIECYCDHCNYPILQGEHQKPDGWPWMYTGHGYHHSETACFPCAVKLGICDEAGNLLPGKAEG